MARTRTRGTVIWAALTASVAATALAATPAAAHVHPITADCESGLVIELRDYDPAGTNTVTVWVDGAVRVDTTFGAGVSISESFGDLYVAHSYRVRVTAWDDPSGGSNWTFDTGTVDVPVCAWPTSAPTTDAPTTTAAVGGGGQGTTTTAAPTTTATTTTTTTTTVVSVEPPQSSVLVAQAPPTVPGAGELPVTGRDSGRTAEVALIAICVGTLFVVRARRPLAR